VQQVPVEGQGLGEHTPPETKKLGNEHAPEVPAAQVPSVAQHAPAWAEATPLLMLTASIATRIASRVEQRRGVLVMGILEGATIGHAHDWGARNRTGCNGMEKRSERGRRDRATIVACSDRTQVEPSLDHTSTRVPK
jgi:hypothetical protein